MALRKAKVEILNSGPHEERYEAGLASAREASYRQGFQDGFSAGYNQRNGSAAVPLVTQGTLIKAEQNSGPRLLGLPCSNCGRFFYSDEAQCPQCKTPKTRKSPEPSDPTTEIR
jgi:hypothetical protein